MSFQDKSLQCSDCGVTFTHSAEDQEYFQSKGYTNEPKRCPECRQTASIIWKSGKSRGLKIHGPAIRSFATPPLHVERDY